MSVEHHGALPASYRLQEYRIERVLGFGGFGITYLATDTNLHKQVALKEYLPSALAMRGAGDTVIPTAGEYAEDFNWGLERFVDEARALARFRHPNLVPVYRFFEANGTAYVVMEYERGARLDEMLRKLPGGLPQREAQQLLGPLLDGLEAVHRAGYLHRDIKPANVILRADGTPVLLDFGAARQALGRRSQSVTAIVTPGYAPLEQYTGDGNQGPWTDLYAVGALAHRLITGAPPPEATARARTDPYRPLARRGLSGYDRDFLEAIDWALRVDEHERPQSVREFRRALLGEAAATAAAVPVAAPRRRKRGLVLAVVALLLLAGAAGGGWYLHQQQLERERLAAEQQRLQAERDRQRAEQERQQAESRRREQELRERAERDYREAVARARQAEQERAEKAAAEKAAAEKAAAEKAAAERAAAQKAAADKAAADRAAADRAAAERAAAAKAAADKKAADRPAAASAMTSQRAAELARALAAEAQKVSVLAQRHAEIGRQKAAQAREQASAARRIAAGPDAKRLPSAAFVYNGQVNAGQREGLGVLTSTDGGHRYEGQWQGGDITGLGVSYDDKGFRYEGEWVSNDRQGHGVSNARSGLTLEGQFRAGKIFGPGISRADGESLEQDWSKAGPDTPVVLRKTDGTVYAGELRNSMLGGFGVLVLANGERYEGQFLNNNRNGYGINYKPDGTKRSGVWRDNVLVKPD